MKINGIAFPGSCFSNCAGPGTGTPYSDNDYEDDWPYLIAQHFNAEITCTGIPGSNMYHSVQSLFGLDSHYTSNKTFDETDLVIFTVTGPHVSIINRDRLPLYYYWLDATAAGDSVRHGVTGDYGPVANVLSEEDMNRFRKEPFTAEEITKNAITVKDFMDNIVDWQSMEVLQRAFLMFVDERLVSMNKKAIWIPVTSVSNRHIPGWCDKWQPKSGPMGNIPLCEIFATIEMDGESPFGESSVRMVADDARRNHFSQEGNERLAEMLIDTIERDPELKPGILDMKPYYPDHDQSKWQQIDDRGKDIWGSDRSTRALFTGYPPDYPFLIP